MAEEKDPGADALEQGYLGTLPDPVDNDAYTVEGQGPETAQREREARADLHIARYRTDDEEDASSSSGGGGTTKKSGSKSSGSGSGSSSSSSSS